MTAMIGWDFMDLINDPLLTSSFKKGRAIFPDWTNKIHSKQSCSHCHQPLFLAFRDFDFALFSRVHCVSGYISQNKPNLS